MNVVPHEQFGHGEIPGDAGFDHQVGQALLKLHSSMAIVVSREFQVLACRGQCATLSGTGRPEAPASLLTPPVKRLVDLAARIGTRQAGTVPLPNRLNGHESSSFHVTAFPPAESPAGPVSVVVFVPAEPDRAFLRLAAATGAGNNRPREMEAELAETRCYLREVIEDYEATTEELRSAHEELQTANEELLKANEDLERSQKVLEQVNRDLRQSNCELMDANRDLVGVLEGIGFPLVILDGTLRVRRFNGPGRQLFSLLPADLGRPLSDFRPKLPISGLEDACREVLGTLKPHEGEVRDAGGRAAVLSIRAFRGAGSMIGGLVLTLTPSRTVLELPPGR